MRWLELSGDSEDDRECTAECAVEASRSPWVSIGVNTCPSCTQVAMGVMSGSHGPIANGFHFFLLPRTSL
jgi:hypothetical protein